MISAKRVKTAKMPRRAVIALALFALGVALLPASASAAPAGPAWNITSATLTPTNLTPGDNSGKSNYVIAITNVGSQATTGSPFTVTDELPEGLTLNPSPSAFGVSLHMFDDGEENGITNSVFTCNATSASCSGDTVVNPGERLYVQVPVNVAPNAPPVVTNKVTISGGGAAAASDSMQTTVSSEPPPFGLERFESSILDQGGAEETRAGSHPYQLHTAAQFNLSNIAGRPVENPRDIVADLPAGVVLNPEATPVRCTESEFESVSGIGKTACPDAAAVGIVHITIPLTGSAVPAFTSPLYNMVPPQGRPAEFAFNAAGVGIPVHLLGKIRSDGDYGLSSETLDVPGVRGDLRCIGRPLERSFRPESRLQAGQLRGDACARGCLPRHAHSHFAADDAERLLGTVEDGLHGELLAEPRPLHHGERRKQGCGR